MALNISHNALQVFMPIRTPEEAEALPVGSIIADVTEPDAPATACKAGRGDWQFLGEDPERRYWSTEILPAPTCKIVLLWAPELAVELY